MDFSLEEFIKYTNAKILKPSVTKDTFSVSTDTRKITSFDVYLPIIGEKFNGHDFIPQAIEYGARGYFTSNEHIIVPNAEFILFVPDTLKAYLQLAEAYKNKLGCKVIAVTGSSGKTTTKEMVACVCSQKFNTHKTLSNHNNEIGFAQTFLSAPSDTQVTVAEMGMRGLGEIDLLAQHATPDIGIITNIGTAHIGRLGSEENIAKAKCELTKYIKNDGLLLIEDNRLADPFIDFCGNIKKINIKEFIQSGKLKIVENSQNCVKFIYRNYEYELSVAGEHNVLDAIYAIEAGLELGINEKDIAVGLKEYVPVGYRWKVENINEFSIINDSYNANLESMKCAIKTFLECYEKPHVLVLGNMGELGDNEVKFHCDLGKFIDAYPPEILITVGDLAKNIAQNTKWNTTSFDDKKGVADYIKKNISKKSNILFKASRSMEFENIIKELEK